MESVSFTKMQGVGNDFVVIDGRGRREFDWPALAVEMCDRHSGIGADGLLVLDVADNADFQMRMFNPDGTPDVCGNGLRCLARYAVENSIAAGDALRIETLAGVRRAQIHRSADGYFESVTIDMGLPHFAPAEIPMRVESGPVVDYPLELKDGGSLFVTVLSTGSTHAVTFVDRLPGDATFFAVSPQVEHHILFPERTSLMWCERAGNGRLRLRIWERGAGETWGCGTGACAVGVAAVLHGYALPDAWITVASRGGELRIRWQEGQSIAMNGPAEVVFHGNL